MVANQIIRTALDETGQGLLEVIFLIPFLFMFVGLLYKINMAAQMAIVNTQYARSQIYVLTANSPEYPRLEFRLSPTMFANNQQDQMILGVSDPSAITGSGAGNTIDPVPQTQKIGRLGSNSKGSDDSGENITKRTEIRVRDTSAICTQLNAVANKQPMNEKNIQGLGSQRWPFNMQVCQYKGI